MTVQAIINNWVQDRETFMSYTIETQLPKYGKQFGVRYTPGTYSRIFIMMKDNMGFDEIKVGRHKKYVKRCKQG